MTAVAVCHPFCSQNSTYMYLNRGNIAYTMCIGPHGRLTVYTIGICGICMLMCHSPSSSSLRCVITIFRILHAEIYVQKYIFALNIFKINLKR